MHRVVTAKWVPPVQPVQPELLVLQAQQDLPAPQVLQVLPVPRVQPAQQVLPVQRVQQVLPGATGPTGPTGATGAAGTVLPGELVTNGTMEQFTDTVPTGWTMNNDALAGQATGAGQVHSGLSAVQLASGAQMRQTLAAAPGSYYRLSFYAQGVGDQPAVTGRIIFTDAAGGESIAADVSVRSQDMVKTAPNFGYYQVISTVVPENVTTVTVYLEATGGTDDSVILDDVSLTVV